MLSRKLMLAVLGLLAFSAGVRCEDAADGEVQDDSTEDEIGGASKDASVAFHFSYPAEANNNRELIAGKAVKYLIGFQNKGEKDFTVKFAETSFRYHEDFNFHLQNFTAAQFNRKVAPKEEVTLDFAFPVYEQFAGRPLGLVVRLHYEDSDNHYFVHTAFNETVTVAEDDSNYKTETYFMYFVFALLGVGALILGQNYLNKLSRKAGMSKRSTPVEKGTTNGEVDFEWIPREVLKNDKKSPVPNSPKPRKAKKTD